MGNPTEELRARLDELGVRWWPDVYYRDTNTCWRVGDFEWRASEKKDGKLLIGCTCVKYLTPEQAIAATVGVDSNTGEAIRKLLDKLNTELCNAGCVIECETREERQRLIDAVKDKYAQAIAATVSAGTCHIIEDEDTGYLTCSECGAIQSDDYTVYHCWCCGKKIKED